MNAPPSGGPDVAIGQGPVPGAHRAIVAMHAAYYSSAWRFGPFFETKVSTELKAFLARYNPAHDRLVLALAGERIVGSLAIDGGEPAAAAHGAHLRWFIIDETCRGRGVGGALMQQAMAFVREAGFSRCYLTTFAGLGAARALYERYGFCLVSEASSQTWGTPVAEQRFEWSR